MGETSELVNKETPLFSTTPVKPTVGRIVHYVASAKLIPDAMGKTHPDVRAMLVTGVNDYGINGVAFRNSLSDESILSQMLDLMNVPQDELEMKSGTWHWPERAPRS